VASGGDGDFHTEDCHLLRITEETCASPNIIRVMKERKMRWVGACSTNGRDENANNILARKPEGKRPCGRDLCVDVKIISEWILGKQGGKVWP